MKKRLVTEGRTATSSLIRTTCECMQYFFSFAISPERILFVFVLSLLIAATSTEFELYSETIGEPLSSNIAVNENFHWLTPCEHSDLPSD